MTPAQKNNALFSGNARKLPATNIRINFDHPPGPMGFLEWSNMPKKGSYTV